MKQSLQQRAQKVVSLVKVEQSMSFGRKLSAKKG
jgi:hypothetical protein